MTETWGMEYKGCDAVSLLDSLCNSKNVVIRTDEGELNTQATFAAQAKCQKITDEFGQWLFKDPARAEQLVAEYNRRFNSLRAHATTARSCACRACRTSSCRTSIIGFFREVRGSWLRVEL